MDHDDWLVGQDHSPIAAPSRRGRFDLVLLDRDGTINARVDGYVRSPAKLRLLPGAAAAVAALNADGARVVLVTNQRGVATGRLTMSQLTEVQAALVARLHRSGAHLDAIELCPHQLGTCRCRKPAPGMLLRALERAPWARLERCVMVGDQPSDVAAADAAAIASVQLRRPDGLSVWVESQLCAKGVTLR